MKTIIMIPIKNKNIRLFPFWNSSSLAIGHSLHGFLANPLALHSSSQVGHFDEF
jgi:hypothetical protein